MSLEISLAVPRAKLKIQEDMLLKAALRNQSRASAIRVPVFGPAAEWPRYRVRCERTGQESLFTGRNRSFKPGQAYDFLPARDGLEIGFHLRDCIRFPEPGRYTIVAECAWKDGQEIAKSAPVTIEVEPMNFLRASASMTQEAYAGMFFVFWTDAGDPKTLKGREPVFRSLVMNDLAPALAGVSELEFSIPLGSDFRIATLPNRSPGKNVWMSWMEGRDVVSRTISYDSPTVSREILTKLPDVRVSLLSNPLSRDIFNLEIPLWLGDKDGETGKIQVAQVNAGGQSRPAGDAMLPAAIHPVWSQTVFLSGGERRLYLLFSDKGKLKLGVVGWQHPMELAPLQQLAQFQGEFAGAGVSLHLNDDAAGILLLRDKDAKHEVQAVSWIQYPNGAFEAAPPHPLRVEGAEKLERVCVKVNERNEPFIAVKSASRDWRLSRMGEDFEPIPGPAGQAKGLFEMILNASGYPLFVYSQPGQGLAFSDASGAVPVPVS